MRNDSRKVVKLAAASGLIPAPLPTRLLPVRPNVMAFRRQQRATNPYPETYRGTRGSYTLPQAQWPPEIREAWQEYRTRCGMRIRETTFRVYLTQMRMYMGYHVNICGKTPTLKDLFDVAQLTEFVLWHAARMGRTLSVKGCHVAVMIATMAKVLDDPAQHRLADFRRSLKVPTPVHIKRNHWVSLAQLEAVAESCLAAGRAPLIPDGKGSRFPGTFRAIRFQHGLILKLLVRIPLRQRNVREMQLDKHLYKDPQTGHWQLHFAGDDLKIGHRGGRVNEYNVNLSVDTEGLVPVLEEFLRVYRPKLPNAQTSPFLFLGRNGIPYSNRTLHLALSEVVAMGTGQRFYPHLIRTIWATEYLTPKKATDDEVPDWTTAAVMLGDKVATVMARYHDQVDQAHHPKAKAFVAKAIQG